MRSVQDQEAVRGTYYPTAVSGVRRDAVLSLAMTGVPATKRVVSSARSARGPRRLGIYRYPGAEDCGGSDFSHERLATRAENSKTGRDPLTIPLT